MPPWKNAVVAVVTAIAAWASGIAAQEEPQRYQRETPPTPIAPPAWASPITTPSAPQRAIPAGYGQATDRPAAAEEPSVHAASSVAEASEAPAAAPAADAEQPAQDDPDPARSASVLPLPSSVSDTAVDEIPQNHAETAPLQSTYSPVRPVSPEATVAASEPVGLPEPRETQSPLNAPREGLPALPPRAKSEELPSLPPPNREKQADGKRWPSALPPVVTVISSLTVVLGLFFAFVWVMRKNAGRGGSLLPKEAFEVLGRAPLMGRQQVQIVRFGNKLVLICISPDGVESLSELTDPVEIDRVAGLCRQGRSDSSTASFQRVLQQVSQSYAPSGYDPAAEPDEYRPPTLASYGRRESRHG